MTTPIPTSAVSIKPAISKSSNYKPGAYENENQNNVKLNNIGSKINSSSDRNQEKKKKKILSWDEYAIEEHDQLRGTRMKIDEPKTPYTHYDDNDMVSHGERQAAATDGDEISIRSHSPTNLEKNSSNLCWDTLEKKLEKVAAMRTRSSSISSVSSKEEEDNKKQKDFKKLRSQHYNEMEILRKFRQEHPDEDEDEDE